MHLASWNNRQTGQTGKRANGPTAKPANRIPNTQSQIPNI
ncbi:hypothetical protein D3OALGA1CA_552 [Olavius algarvensis associated proteobacterium Delta 3]|nr:hypothetical protein D3OALGA1CA_552 [Olavius algarvensis associated proteobacterium Delta 3]